MYDAGKILTALAVFLVLVTAPFWSNALTPAYAKAEPKITTTETRCVASRDVMRATHMDILDQWRDTVVREGVRTVAVDGRQVKMSLTNTCMSCHANRAEFCDTCHNQLAVAPTCWSCHVEPKPQGRV